MWKCVVCKESYSQLHSIITAECEKHSFHKNCEKEKNIYFKYDDEFVIKNSDMITNSDTIQKSDATDASEMSDTFSSCILLSVE